MGKRAVCLNCMDGRIQLPVIYWIKEQYGVDNVDMVTDAGMDGILADSTQVIDHVYNKVDISYEKNNAQMIVIVGHHDCRGNPVSHDEHKACVKSAVTRLKEKFPSRKVIGVWVNEQWTCEKI